MHMLLLYARICEMVEDGFSDAFLPPLTSRLSTAWQNDPEMVEARRISDEMISRAIEKEKQEENLRLI